MALNGFDNIGIGVRDLDAVASFFEDSVGLKVERDDTSEPRSASVHVGDHYLYVFETTGQPVQVARDGGLVANTPGIDHVSFSVDSVDAEVTRLSGKGVVFDGEPATNEEWGIRLVGFVDPEGNRYYLVENL